MNPEALLLLSTARGITGDPIVGGAPEWTQEDVALALRGVSERDAAAALLKVTGDPANKRDLYLPLYEAAVKLRRWNKWPKKVGGKKWLEPCVFMALEEWRDPAIVRRQVYWKLEHPTRAPRYLDYPHPRAIRLIGWWTKYIEIDSGLWHRLLLEKYNEIYTKLVIWSSIALRQVRKNIGQIDG
jgi:hypothetical protein